MQAKGILGVFRLQGPGGRGAPSSGDAAGLMSGYSPSLGHPRRWGVGRGADSLGKEDKETHFSL